MDIPSQSGKTAVVTGANTGIGEVTARELARAGARIYLACRNQQKAEDARERILAEVGADADVRVVPLDLGGFASVRKGAEALLAKEDGPIDILVNNAGLAGIKGTTEEGFEIAFGVNHLGHFLYTLMLMPRLKQAPSARIVNVSSRAHYRAEGIDWQAIREVAPSVTGMGAYEVSKLANVLFTKELARRLGDDSTITTYALHPGVVASDIWRKVPAPFRWVMKRFMITNEEGAETSLYCATSPKSANETGLYYDSCRVKDPSAVSKDEALAKELWEKSMEWTDAPAL